MRIQGTTEALGLWCFAPFTRSMGQMNNGRPTGFLRVNPDARFASRMLSSSDLNTTTTIPMVGIGFFPPNDAADELPPANNSELIKELEDDERVTVQSIELGELLCESLVNAENAPALQFALSLDEILTANMTSYTEYNGSVFADGIIRKVWTGEVVHDQEEVSSQTASMTWGEECDVETFLLEVPTKFVNGTLIVAKTIPCEASRPKEICIVELELELPDEPSSEVIVVDVEVSENDRRLRDASARSEEEFKLDTEPGTMRSVRRQLQSTTQIDLMFLYTPGGRDILGVSDSQMQSELADYVNGMNTAMDNSDVDLQFSLVRVEPLPYIEESALGSVMLENLKTNSDVAALRNTYGADLVQLVTDLNPFSISGICGFSHIPSSPNEAFAFSLVDPYCFFQLSHTHEIAHNLGCYHDRDNTANQHEYAHGYRYCDGDLPYRTIMALACLDENGLALPVNRLNFFSNPDLVHNGRPTGTADNNCARRLKETMGDVASYRDSGSTSITPAPVTSTTIGSTTDTMTCSNGILGVERDGICCTLGCGTCGGSGCNKRAREAGLASEDCCITTIEKSGVLCEDSRTAPCIFGGGMPESLTTDVVEVGERTTVVVTANGHDERTSDYGCAPDGCKPENTRDGSLSTRWSCKESLLGGVNCKITFELSEPQDLDVIRIAFYKGAERTRKLKVKINGSTYTEIVSSGQTDEFEVFQLGTDSTSEVTLEGLELGLEDWIALTEVQLMAT